jgi:magnesium-transporting ATPase (P-type)
MRTAPLPPYHSMPVEACVSALDTSLDQGLTTAQATRNSLLFPKNTLTSPPPPTLVSEVLEKLRDPLNQLLLTSAVLSVLIGNYDDAVSIILALAIGITCVYQTYTYQTYTNHIQTIYIYVYSMLCVDCARETLYECD